MNAFNDFLAIETATDASTLALCYQGEVEYFHEVAPKRHSELLLPQLDILLKARGIQLSDLEAIVVGEGPGSFTGVRMGLSVAQGLCFSAGLAAFQIPTLLALALSGVRYPIEQAGSVIVALDARMGEVYAQRFEIQDYRLIPQVAPCLGTLRDVLSTLITPGDTSLCGIGNGFSAYAEDWQSYRAQFEVVLSNDYPHAGHFSEHLRHYPNYAKLIETFSKLSPVYIRDKVTY